MNAKLAFNHKSYREYASKLDQSKIIGVAIASRASQIIGLAKRIHAHPEIGFNEHRAAAWQVGLLKKWGFKVTCPFAGLATAYRAIWKTFNAGNGPVFCFLSEYDALPGLGHGCGHNLIAAASLGAGAALADALSAARLPGSVIVMGTPAEEGGGGKIAIIRKGGFNKVDAVMMAHPSFRTVPDGGSTMIAGVQVIFYGVEAHAAGFPEKGKNALDAVICLFNAVNAWRQHIVEDARVHGIITEGGVKPNIIPGRASCIFYLRALSDTCLAGMQKRFIDMVRGAALITGTRYEIRGFGQTYAARIPNAPLNQSFLSEAKSLGLNPQIPARALRGSSDFGNVSRVVPGVHVYFGIASREIPGHSKIFTKAASSPYAFKQMLRAAEAMARVGWSFFKDAEFRKAVKNDFQSKVVDLA